MTLERFDWPQLVWLIMALLLVAGAGTGFRRLRFDTQRSLLSLLIWGGLIAAIALAYAAFNGAPRATY